METGEKIGLAITIVVMLGYALITEHTGAAKVDNATVAPAVQQVAIVEEATETKTYEPYEHVFYERYYTSKENNPEEVQRGQIEIPAGYEILEIENWEETEYKSSQTGGFDVWFINKEPVEVTAIYNDSIKAYDYSVPGTVIQRELAPEEGPEKKLTP